MSAPRIVLGLAPSERVSWAESRTLARLVDWSGAGRVFWANVPLVNVYDSAELAAGGRRAYASSRRRRVVAEVLAGAEVLALGGRLPFLVWGGELGWWQGRVWRLTTDTRALLAGVPEEQPLPASVTVVPHPSGRSHAYNDPVAVENARRVLRRWARP